MNVRIFVTHHLDPLEGEINEWLQSKQPTIKFIAQSEGYQDGKRKLVVSVWYEE
jgi:hypothetical protein